MAADGCVDAARDLRQFGEQRCVKRLAHAVQPLKLEPFHAAGILDHAGDGERVVGGELRKNTRSCAEERSRASHVAEIGHGFAREHRVVGQSAFLRALDLGVPVRALDQADGQPAAERDGRLFDPADHRESAFLIGLHRKPESVPAAQRPIAEHGRDDVERQFQPVRFLGVDREGKLAGLGEAREFDHAWRQFRQHALARDGLEARMQRGELYRNSRPSGQGCVAGTRSDRRDRSRVGVEIFLGVGRVARAFAEHVERIAKIGVAAGARQSFVDGLAKHEVRTDQPHRLARRGAQSRQADPPRNVIEDRVRRLARMDDAGGDAERPGRG